MLGSIGRQLKQSLRDLGRAHREISALYLFGSSAKGKAGLLSDLDVAVLLDDSRPKRTGSFGFSSGLLAEVMRVCRRSDADLVVLNGADPLLAYEVVSGSVLLYERDRAGRVAYEAGAVCRYLDLLPFLQTARGYLKKHLREGTYGG